MKTQNVPHLLLTPLRYERSLFLPSYYQVAPEKTLITPVQCKSLWRQFKNETEYTVTQAISAQVFFAIPTFRHMFVFAHSLELMFKSGSAINICFVVMSFLASNLLSHLVVRKLTACKTLEVLDLNKVTLNFRKLTDGITTGCHLHGQSLPWSFLDSMNL